MILQSSKCKFCGDKFDNPGLELIIGAQNKVIEMNRFMNVLARHLMEKHPSELRRIEVESVGFQGALRMLAFEHTEPDMIAAIQTLGDKLQEMFKPPTDTGKKENPLDHA